MKLRWGNERTELNEKIRNEKRIDNFHRERVQLKFELVACGRVVAMLSSDTESSDDNDIYTEKRSTHC